MKERRRDGRERERGRGGHEGWRGAVTEVEKLGEGRKHVEGEREEEWHGAGEEGRIDSG